MSRIKGKYVAQIEMDIDAERTEDINSLEYIRDRLVNGYVTTELENLVSDEMGDYVTVTVTQQYADAWEVQDDE